MIVQDVQKDDIRASLSRMREALIGLRQRRARKRLERRYDRKPTEATKARDRRILGETDE
jgi:hypothetical protein